MTKVSLDMDIDVLIKLQKAAIKNQRTVAAQIRFIIAEFFKE